MAVVYLNSVITPRNAVRILGCCSGVKLHSSTAGNHSNCAINPINTLHCILVTLLICDSSALGCVSRFLSFRSFSQVSNKQLQLMKEGESIWIVMLLLKNKILSHKSTCLNS